MTEYVTSGARRITVGELHRRAAQAATGFAALGVAEGEAVAIMMRNDLPFLEAILGAGLRGAYSVPINWHFKGEEAGYILADSGARVLVAHADLLPSIAAHLPAGLTLLTVETPPEICAAYGLEADRAGAGDGAIPWESWRAGFAPWAAPPADGRGSMIYTSGTTGRPKGVRRASASEATQQAVMRRVGLCFGCRPGMRALLTGPLYHSAPNAYARLAIAAGGSLALMPRFDPETLLRLIDEHRFTHMHMVPTMFVRLLRLPPAVRAAYDVSCLDHVIHGAAPCPPEVKRKMIDWWGPVIHEYYGSTEAGLVTTVDSETWLARPGTVGRPLPGTVVRICDDDGRALAPGEIGDIYMNMPVYSDFTYHNDDAGRRAIERDGLITNGDRGYLDDEGYLFLRDRKTDMVISGGVNIYPAEIEAVLLRLEGVRDCAVFGIPDAVFGEALAAAVEREPGAKLDAAEVRAFVGAHLAGYKVPKLVAFHDRLPREDSGKIFKRKLRAPYWIDAGRRI